MNGEEDTEVKLKASDYHENYSVGVNCILGIVQLICGLLSMALGIGAICTWSSGYYIGYGIWCGFIFMISGCICMAAASRKTTCLIMTNMVFAIMGACLGAVQFSLGVVAAENDAPGRGRDPHTGRLTRDYNLFYDIYYPRNNMPATNLCAGWNSGLGWAKAWGPVDILLIIAGFIEGVAAVIAAILCCQAVCCGLRRVYGMTGLYYGNTGTGTTGYSNEGYLTDPRISPSPPLYKVM